jgi:hypothetical protein
MKFLAVKHMETYTEKQNALLSELLFLQKNHFVFVCDKLPMEDKASEYIRTAEYPIYEGGKKFFSLAVAVEQKFWISWFNRIRIEKVGAIKWEFDGEAFDTLALEIYSTPFRRYRAEIDRLMAALEGRFNCKATKLAINANRQNMHVAWKNR